MGRCILQLVIADSRVTCRRCKEKRAKWSFKLAANGHGKYHHRGLLLPCPIISRGCDRFCHKMILFFQVINNLLGAMMPTMFLVHYRGCLLPDLRSFRAIRQPASSFIMHVFWCEGAVVNPRFE